jgi:hypothetical protein
VAQQPVVVDTVETVEEETSKDKASRHRANYRANRAALYSAVLPGLGQAYNRKYWKLPILYVGAGAITYFLITNNQSYKEYYYAYENRLDGDATNDTYLQYTDDQLKILRDDFRRYYQMNIFMAVGLYALNIVDAYVDAHLKEFDVNENLSFKVKPYFYTSNNINIAQGLTLSLRLK